MIKRLLLTWASIEALELLRELHERRQVFTQARAYADSIGKPLLVVGTPKFVFNHPCGDVTIDIDRGKARWCNTEVADIRAIPYPEKYFGAAFASHVLEHLPTISDAHGALSELHRVADEVFVVVPRKLSLLAWINQDHHLWLTPQGDDFLIEQRGKARHSLASCLTAITEIS